MTGNPNLISSSIAAPADITASADVGARAVCIARVTIGEWAQTGECYREDDGVLTLV